jgi:hypothetical protein
MSMLEEGDHIVAILALIIRPTERNPHKPIAMDHVDIRTLHLLEEIEKNHSPSQRQLARHLDIPWPGQLVHQAVGP